MDPKGFVNCKILHKCKASVLISLPVVIEPCHFLTNDGFKTDYHFKLFSNSTGYGYQGKQRKPYQSQIIWLYNF